MATYYRYFRAGGNYLILAIVLVVFLMGEVCVCGGGAVGGCMGVCVGVGVWLWVGACVCVCVGVGVCKCMRNGMKY